MAFISRQHLGATLLAEFTIGRAASSGALVVAIETGLLLLAGWLDNSFFLEGTARGVLEHPGAWGIIFGDFFVFLAVSTLFRSIRKIPARFPVSRTPVTRRYIRMKFGSLLEGISMRRKKTNRIFLYTVAVSFSFWLNNAYQTTDPIRYYGNELFDSSTFICGYLSMRVILFFSWVVLLPYVAITSALSALTIFRMVRTLDKRRLLSFSIYHPDGCGGFSYFGNLNVAIVMGLIVVYFELAIVLFTHHRLNPGLASGFIIVTLFTVALSYAMMIPVFAALSDIRRRFELSIYRAGLRDYSMKHAIMQITAARVVSFNPYQTHQKIFIQVARVVPVVASAIKLYISS